MATAPRPGEGQRRAVAAKQSALATITVQGEVFKLAVGTMRPREKLTCRIQTGLPFESFWRGGDHIGEDSVVVMWWLARRAGGEPDLTWDDAEPQWPVGLTDGEIEFKIDQPDDGDDHPEPSGPGSSTPGPPSPTTSV